MRKPTLVLLVAMACAAAPPGASAPAHRAWTEAASIDRESRPAPPADASPPSFRVLVGGDLLPHRPQLLEPASIGAALEPLVPLFRRADAVIANYESATGDPRDLMPETLSLAASADWIAAVRSAGVDSLTVANNHSCDLGRRGLLATVAAARSVGATPLGAGEDPWAPHVIAENAGKRVCAIAWTTLSNDTKKGCAGSADLAFVKPDARGRSTVGKAVSRARAKCDATIAIFHAGDEYVAQTQSSLAMATAVAEAGADAVLMHHPHVVSPLVVVTTRDGRRVPVFESLGNLVSNQGETWTAAWPARQPDRRIVYLNGWTRLGMLADLTISFEPNRPKVRFGYHLVWTDNDHYKDKSAPRPRIETRLMDPSDAPVIERLRADPTGPVGVFDDACRIHDLDRGASCE